MKQLLAATLLAMAAVSLSACDRVGAVEPALSAEAAQDPNPAMSAPDQVAWSVFIEAVTPTGGKGTAFETWPSDHDTFSPGAQPIGGTARPARDGIDHRPPVLPTAEPAQAAGAAHAPDGTPSMAALGASGPQPPIPSPTPPGKTDNGCDATGDPQFFEPACDGATVEEVRRNVSSHNYIVENDLNSRSGLVNAFNADMTITFPNDSVEVKLNWIPVSLLPEYYPGFEQSQFYVATDMVEGQEQPYALIAMHVISKEVPNWTWATFEHAGNRGRCDFLGCTDSFGAQTPFVAAANDQGQNQGTVYPACRPTPALQAMFDAAGVDPVFGNYCLKGSQTDFTDAQGLAVRLGNSVTESGFVPQASCMTCHGEANINSAGQATTTFGFVNGSGQVGPLDPAFYWSAAGGQPPYYQGQPGLTRTAISADFVWSIPFCAYDDVTNPNDPPPPSPCAAK